MRVPPSTYQKWGEIESTSARQLVSRSSMLIQRSMATDGTKLQAKQCNYTNSSTMQQVQSKLFVDITLIVHDFSDFTLFQPNSFQNIYLHCCRSTYRHFSYRFYFWVLLYALSCLYLP